MGKSNMERRSFIFYGIATLVILVSFGAALLLPISQESRSLVLLPAIASLFTILVQGWRDQVAHERARDLKQQEQSHLLAVASHMANVVFDKQVAFCEEYAQTLQKALLELFQRGPNQTAAIHQHELRQIRLKYSPWTSRQLTDRLMPFEKALLEIAGLHQILENQPVGATRTHTTERMFDIFMKVVGMSDPMPTDAPEAADMILDHLKDALNVSDFEELRRSAIRAATARLPGG